MSLSMSSIISSGTWIAGLSSSHFLKCSSSLNLGFSLTGLASAPSSTSSSSTASASTLASNSYSRINTTNYLQLKQFQDQFIYSSPFQQQAQ